MAGDDPERLRRLLLERSVRRGDFVLASGQRSSYYIDCRLTTMSAEGQGVIGRLGWRAIRDKGWRPKAVGGLTMGADPVAYAIAAASWETEMVVDAFSVRKDAKAHGMGRVIEGCFSIGDEVVIVEDVIT
ncbi:MAG: orotate phosphoribosyltransferase, partial [Gemmatimonadales bacterium]|nr:orotate phosphoribosyltransferase [Gemmatimonadales bacterium]